LKNRLPQEIEDAIVTLVIEQPAFGQARLANQLGGAGLRPPACAVCGCATAWRL
jgi:hypothetical protein